MRPGFALALVVVLTNAAAGASVVHVDVDAAPGGDGTTWATAFDDLHDALAAAGSGDQLWIAEGVYRPDGAGGSVGAAFVLPSDVSVHGGFDGTETVLEQRDPALHQSILDGDLDDDDDARMPATLTNNSIRIVSSVGVTGTLLDGLVLSRAGAWVPGGAIFIDGGDLEVIGCTIRDCWTSSVFVIGAAATFADCKIQNALAATSGAGMHLESATVELTGCSLSNNDAYFDGGAIHLDAASMLTATSCSVFNNRTSTAAMTPAHGGAIGNLGGAVVIDDCGFIGNVAFLGSGGAIYCQGGSLDADGCRFETNVALPPDDETGGGAIAGVGGAAVEVDASCFDANAAMEPVSGAGAGGALLSHESTVTVRTSTIGGGTAGGGGGGGLAAFEGEIALDGCTIDGNMSVASGGGVALFGAHALVVDTLVSSNLALDRGGGVIHFLEDEGLALYQESVLEDNEAVEDGGGLWLAGGSATFESCAFRANEAGDLGGGGSFRAGNVAVSACSFTANNASRGGGAVIVTDGLFSRCAFIGNHATTRAGGLLFRLSHEVEVADSLISGNTTGGHGGAVVANLFATPAISSCTIVGNAAAGSVGGVDTSSDESVGSLAGCILWGNSDLGGRGESAQIMFSTAGGTIDYSIVQGLTGGLGGVGNLGVDPMLVDPDGADDVPGTEDDDARLQPGSPAIDAGDNDAVPPGLVLDLDGLDRFVDDPDTIDTGNAGVMGPPIVDIGAYELQVCPYDCADRDGHVTVVDLLQLLAEWDASGGPCDVGGDGADVVDLLGLLAAWGPC